MTEHRDRVRLGPGVLRELRRPLRRSVGFARLRAAIDAEMARPRRVPGAGRWLLPGLGVAALGVLLGWLGGRNGRDQAGGDADTALLPVQFVLVAPEATTVGLVGDFNGWDALRSPMTRGEDGIWSITLRLQPGPVSYSFVVDGSEWRADPSAPAVSSDFGRPSSVALVSRGGVQ